MRNKIIMQNLDGSKLSALQKKLLDIREKESLAGKNSKKNWEEIKTSIKSRKK